MLINNELKYAYRQPIVWVASIAVCLFSTLIGLGSLHEQSTVNELYQVYALLQMLIMPAAFAVIAVTLLFRDHTSNMMSLIDVTPVSFRVRWRSRVIVSIAILSFPMLFSFVVVCGVFASQTTWLMGLQSFFLISLFGIVQSSFLLILMSFYLAKRSCTPFTLYAISAAVGIVYIFIGGTLGFPFLSGSTIVSEMFYTFMLWADPFGITPLLDVNDTNQALNVPFIANRIVYLLLGALVFIGLSKFSVNPNVEHNNKKAVKTTQEETRHHFVYKRLPDLPVVHLLFLNFKVLLNSKLTPVILVVWASIVLNEALSTLLSAQAYNLNNSITSLNAVAWDVYLLFTSVCLALWSGLVCWHTQRNQFADVLSSAPVSNWKKIMADMVTLLFCLLVLTVVMGVASLMAELIAGSDISLSHYVQQIIFSLIPQALLAVIFVCIHHIAKSVIKAGLCIFALLIIKFTPITSALGITHLLWNIAGSPLQPASQTKLFLESEQVFLPFMLFWSLVAATLCVFAVKLSHRGTGYVINKKIWSMPAVVMVLLTLGVGGGMHVQITNEKPLTYQKQRMQWQAQYEQAFRHFADLPQPTMTELETKIAFYPEQGKAYFDVQYTLKNTSEYPISHFLVSRDGNHRNWSLTLINREGEIKPPKLNQYEIRLAKPLEVGQSLSLKINFMLKQVMFWPSSEHLIIKPKWSKIAAQPILPMVGYQPEFEIQDPLERANKGLIAEPSQTGVLIKAMLRTTLSTQLEHESQAPGVLSKQWQEDGRMFYQFSTNQPTELDVVWQSEPRKILHE